MRAEIIFIVVLETVALTTLALIAVRRLVARAQFNRIIARFERDLATPSRPPRPDVAAADEDVPRWNE